MWINDMVPFILKCILNPIGNLDKYKICLHLKPFFFIFITRRIIVNNKNSIHLFVVCFEISQ